MAVQCLINPPQLEEINMKLDRIIVILSRLSEQSHRATVPVSRAPASVPRRTALRKAPSLTDVGNMLAGAGAMLDPKDQPPEEPESDGDGDGDGDTCMEGDEAEAPAPAVAKKNKRPNKGRPKPKRCTKRAAPSPVQLSEDDDFVVEKEPVANY